MTVPRFSQGAALLVWGWQVNLLEYAAPMAILLESHHLTRRRWALDKTDLYRVADLTTVLLVGLIVYLATSVPLSHFLLQLVELTPALFYPLVLVLAYSTWEKLPLDVLFYSLRRQPGEQAEWDLNYLYIGVCLVATGTNADAKASFLPISAAMIVWTLWAARPQRYSAAFCLLTIVAAFAVATVAHMGLHEAHLAVKERTTAWLADLMDNRRDPFRTATAIGMVGRLKLSSAIVMRVEKGEQRDPLLYLQEASYDWLSGNEWMTMQRSFQPLEKIDQFSWRIRGKDAAPGSARTGRIRIYQAHDEDRGLVPVPPGTVTIEEYPALELMVNRYDSIQATGIMSAPTFTVTYRDDGRTASPREGADLSVPDEFVPLMESELGALIPPDLSPAERVDRVRAYFAPFRYTLYQPEAIAREDPLRYFLQERRAGHCEFFATATVLLLRQAGIPARYAVGYVVQEFDPLTDTYLVRRSHAHAWAVAHVAGAWEIVDTTPSTWLEMEAEAASPFTPLVDLLTNLAFEFGRWREKQRIEDYTYWLYGIAFLLTVILLYRLMRSEQVLVESQRAGGAALALRPGGESPFYLVERHLAGSGHLRLLGEPLLAWISRIGHLELQPLVREHYAWRFDPRGISHARQEALALAVDDWLTGQEAMRQQTT